MSATTCAGEARVHQPATPVCEDQHIVDILELRRPGCWLPAMYALIPLAAASGALLTAPVIFGNEANAALSGMVRTAGWVALAATIAVGTVGWVFRRPARILLASEGFWMPPLEGSSGSVWIPYRDVEAVHRWSAWRPRRPRVLVLALRRRLPRSWAASSFSTPEALERFSAAVRAGVGRLPDGRERLCRMERRAIAATIAQRGWPVASLGVVLLLTLTFIAEIGLGALVHRERLIVLGANVTEAVAEGQLFRLVTANLLHLSGLHFGVNSLMLLAVGGVVERLLGARRFAAMLAGSALAGSIVAAVSYPGGASLGASAAVYGGLASWIYLMVAYRDEVPGNLYLPPRWGLLGAAVCLGYEALLPPLVGDVRGHAPHAVGFATGLVLTMVTTRGTPLAELARTSSKLVTGLAVSLGAIFVGGLVWGVASIDWAALG